jgi:hypothetical protein
MPDITMCEDNECEQKDKCWRFTAKPNYHQYFFTDKVKTDKNVCEYFMSNKGR